MKALAFSVDVAELAASEAADPVGAQAALIHRTVASGVIVGAAVALVVPA